MLTFERSNALVVGAASGIGRALALEFSRRGARVAAADLDRFARGDDGLPGIDIADPEIAAALQGA